MDVKNFQVTSCVLSVPSVEKHRNSCMYRRSAVHCTTPDLGHHTDNKHGVHNQTFSSDIRLPLGRTDSGGQMYDEK